MPKEKLTVAVIDGGGRGSALVQKYAQSSEVERLIAIPGNDYLSSITKKPIETFPNLKTTDREKILALSKYHHINLVDVAQDDAIESGLVDILSENNIPTLGPTRNAGEIEWNKAWARKFGTRHNLPQPEYQVFSDPQLARDYISSQPNQPWFIKAAFLAAGKGALPAKNNREALRRIEEMKQLKGAGRTFLIEKWLQGDHGTSAEEFSAFAVSDGKNHRIIGYAQDHKRVFDEDKGENTGGMGAVTPPLVISDEVNYQVEDIFSRTFRGLQQENRPYKGVLFLGGILLPQGLNKKVYVVEFNARWGDPEAQVLLPGISTNFIDLARNINSGTISQLKLTQDHLARVVVAGAIKGYPGEYKHLYGKEIYGIEEAADSPHVILHGAGMKRKNNRWTVNGGRLFYIVGEGENVIEARRFAYDAMAKINIEGHNLHYRRDIGYRDVNRLSYLQV